MPLAGSDALPLLRRPTIALVASLAATCGVLSLGSGGPASTAEAATSSTAPSGLSTVAGLLSSTASAFSDANTGWTAYGNAVTQQVSNIGHAALGALAVSSAGPWTGASSPVFSVTPGERYTATSWMLAGSAAHSVGLALRFFDAQGNQISAGNQIGQGLASSTTSWTSTMPVVGFAPANAATGQVVFLDYDGPAGDVQILDDLNVTRTTGAAAPIAAPLTTSGNHVLDRYGRVVTLRGVVVDGLEITQWAQVSTRDIDEAHAWGANFVRIPLSQDFVLPNACGYDTSGYLPRVDALVNEATSLHMVSLLDLHTNAEVPCTAPTQQKMADQRSVDFWKLIAARYKNNPYVAFDLYNEPHDITDSVWRNGGAVTSSGVTYVAAGMQTLYNAVRATGAKNLVVASGNNWANDYPALAPLTGTNNLIYGVHAYTCPTGTPETGHTCYAGPTGVYDPNGILNRWAAIGAKVPVMLTEFGYPDTNDGRYIANATASVASRGWAGWSVYAFTGNNNGLWNLIKDTSSLNDPSIAGMAVVNALR